jgi:hypothetical protein
VSSLRSCTAFRSDSADVLQIIMPKPLWGSTRSVPPAQGERIFTKLASLPLIRLSQMHVSLLMSAGARKGHSAKALQRLLWDWRIFIKNVARINLSEPVFCYVEKYNFTAPLFVSCTDVLQAFCL